jgi:hypothetical protein
VFMKAALVFSEPFFGRNGVELLVDSTTGTSDLFDDRLCSVVMDWIDNPKPDCTLQNQVWVRPTSPDETRRAIRAVARSMSPHTHQWRSVEVAACEYMEPYLHKSNVSVRKRACAWANTWREIRSMLGLCYSLFNRIRTVSVIVISLNTSCGLANFARNVVLTSTSYEMWADACAQQMEEQARNSLFKKGDSPCFPPKAKFKKQSAMFLSNTSSLELPCMDTRSVQVLAQVRQASQSPDTHNFCSACSGYRNLVSVMCCSFRTLVE